MRTPRTEAGRRLLSSVETRKAPAPFDALREHIIAIEREAHEQGMIPWVSPSQLGDYEIPGWSISQSLVAAGLIVVAVGFLILAIALGWVG